MNEVHGFYNIVINCMSLSQTGLLQGFCFGYSIWLWACCATLAALIPCCLAVWRLLHWHLAVGRMLHDSHLPGRHFRISAGALSLFFRLRLTHGIVPDQGHFFSWVSVLLIVTYMDINRRVVCCLLFGRLLLLH